VLCDGGEKGVGFYRWRGGASPARDGVGGGGDGGGHVGGKLTAVNADEREYEG
jgi:hypothetical protein